MCTVQYPTEQPSTQEFNGGFHSIFTFILGYFRISCNHDTYPQFTLVIFGYIYVVRIKGKILIYTMLYEVAMVASTFFPSMGILATHINRTSDGVPWGQPLSLQFSLSSGR